MRGAKSLVERALTIGRTEGTAALLRRAGYFGKMRVFSMLQRSPVTRRIYYDWFDAPEYWEKRYADERPAGPGSEGEHAAFKADVLNEFVATHGIETVMEFGCGDGYQVELADYPEYVGLEVSESAVEMCAERFADDDSKSFFLYDPAHFINSGALSAELVLSLEVLFHLVDDQVFEKTMHDMFSAAERYVIIFSSNHERSTPELHIRHRNFTEYVEREFPNFDLVETVANDYEERLSDFYVYEKADQ